MKSFYKNIFFLLILLPKISIAQLSICYDNDGYTNIRKSASINSKVIGKIIEGQVFAISTYTQEEENKSTDWVAISFPLTNNLNEKDFLKFDGEENEGYIHKSRLVELEDLPKLKMIEIDSNKVFHSDQDIEILIETQKFKESNHKIIKTKEGVFLVDGIKAYPYYGGETTEIKNIILKANDNTFSFPIKYFKNLFMVNASNTKAYKGTKGEYYLVIDAGDGADYYNIIYCLKNNNIFSMTVTSTIP
ncbi:hypothetical protein ABF176_002556 [Flavobacterium psychrophilum]